MQYTKTVPCKSQPKTVLDLASKMLGQAGLLISKSKDSSLEFSSPGYRSTKQHPLRGVSKGILSVTGHQITIKADLEKLEFLQKFVFILPILITSIVFISLLLIFMSVFPMWIAVSSASIVLITYLPWLYFSPLLSKKIRQKTEKALEDLSEYLSIV